MKVAVIGSGISGLVSAYVLSREHDVTIFEAAAYCGGHTNTIDVSLLGKAYAVDTGFIVYNERTYPAFIRLLDELGVASQATNMSFSVSNGSLEYASHLRGFFSASRNWIDPRLYRMLADKLRFDRLSKALLREDPAALDGLSLKDFLVRHRFSDSFARWYILPMTAAVWSAPLSGAAEYPVRTLLSFLNNHGLLGFKDAPTWRVIQGGSRQYVRALLARYSGRVLLNTAVRSVSRDATGVSIQTDGASQRFDRVVFACHSDQALAMLSDPSAAEQDVLSALRYQQNAAVLHTDSRLLPRRRSTWAAWNYQLAEDDAPATLTYNMNLLQGIEAPEAFCVTLNQEQRIDPARVIRRIDYAHPIYDHVSQQARGRWDEISSHANRSFYCGAYWFNGFHEDGTQSALRVCGEFGLGLESHPGLELDRAA